MSEHLAQDGRIVVSELYAWRCAGTAEAGLGSAMSSHGVYFTQCCHA
ncbi:MAG: hypothetical protein WDM89_22675 [Rhizomicrobium sp.]